MPQNQQITMPQGKPKAVLRYADNNSLWKPGQNVAKNYQFRLADGVQRIDTKSGF